MKKKELKNLAKKIASAEMELSSAQDKKDIKHYQDQIIELSGQIDNPNDLFLLDAMIQEILEKFDSKKNF